MYSKNQMLVLALFFAHPGEEFYLSQIGEILGKRPGYFQRGINALESEGILQSRKRGNQRVFAVDENYPLLSEVRSIVGKTIGVEGTLRDFAATVQGIDIALIYGSYAKNALKPNSDIDLLLVASEEDIEEAVITRLTEIEKKIQREVNYTMYSADEFSAMRSAHDPFIEEVLGGPFILLRGKL